LFLEILIIILLLSILLYLIISTLRSRRGFQAPETDRPPGQEDQDSRNPCPLCRSLLSRGERVHSVVFSRGEDRLMNIYGCPYCYRDHPAGSRSSLKERYCPSCGTLLKEGSFAVARVFERPGRKPHVHVLGCPVCRRNDRGEDHG